MKSLWKIFAVSLLVGCQAASSQNAAKESQPPAPHYACPTNPVAEGVEIVSDTSGVDFKPYFKKWVSITDRNWYRLMPKEAKWPILEKGLVQIRFKILPNGKVKPRDVVLQASSGNPAFDRAAWKAIKKSKYPRLPKEFKKPYLAMQFCFYYNMQSPEDSSVVDKVPKS
jgi:TonB family protein